MKKSMRKFLSICLMLCILISSLMLGSVFAGAMALEPGVSIDFKKADNDWVTLNNNTITDEALCVTIYNFTESTVVLSKLESNGTAIRFSGWSEGTALESSGVTTVGISGKVANNTVLTVTLTYYTEGKPVSTAETCTAYIYASDSQTYTEAKDNAKIDGGLGVFGLNTNTTISPVSSFSTSQSTATRTVALFVVATCHDPSTTATVYVDGSKYKTWDEFNFHLEFYNDGDQIDHAFIDKMTISQTSNTGSMFILDYGCDANHKTVTSEYNDDKNSAEGFFLLANKNATAPALITGKIPGESKSVYTIDFRQYGQTKGVFGALSSKTVEMHSRWNITVHNNDKSKLREKLNEYSALGLNRASYKTGWEAYEKALKNAYTVLGTIKKTAEDVQNAIDTLDTAYHNLVRYAVVYTNHYYYTGHDNTAPVLVKTDLDMYATNNATYSAEVLNSADYSAYVYNRGNVVKQKRIGVDDTTNFTDVIDQYYWYVDTAALERALRQYESTIHLDEAGNDIYSIDSWHRYASAAAAAQRVLASNQAFQTDIDAALNALLEAQEALVRLEPDTEWLEEGIGWAANIIDNSFDDDSHGWDTDVLFASAYAQRLYSDLVLAYNEAVKVTNNPEFTKADADRVCIALWQAIDALRVRDEQTKGLLYEESTCHADLDHYGYYKNSSDIYTEQNGLSVVFNDILNKNTGTYRLNEADFTAESWENLYDALYGDFGEGSWACAQTAEPYPTYDGEDEMDVPAYSMIHNIWNLSTQADYNACRDNLIDKVNHLEWVIDATPLEEKLAEANAYMPADYTAASFELLESSIERAQAMLDELQNPQYYGDAEALGNENVEAMVRELTAVISYLQPKPYAESAVESVTLSKEGEERIYGVPAGSTCSQALADLNIVNQTEDVLVRVYTSTGKLAALNERVGTGYKVVLSGTDGEKFKIYTFVIKGDADGNGKVNTADFDVIYENAFSESLSGVFFEAADLNADDVVDLSDAVLLQEMI